MNDDFPDFDSEGIINPEARLGDDDVIDLSLIHI